MLIFLLLIFIATGMKPHTGDRVVKFEEDNTERRNKKMNRRNGLFKSAYDLDTITGGSTLVVYKDINQNTYVYAGSDQMWESFRQQGLK